MTDEWFGPVTYSDGEAEGSPFLEAVRRLAPNRLTGLIEPDATVVSSYPVAPFVLLCLDVALTEDPGEITLKVLFDGRGGLSGTWGGDDIWDGFDRKHPDNLLVHARSFSDERHAVIALDWVAAQLNRPLVEKQWVRRGKIVARVWATGDTGDVLEVSGRRRFRGEADIVRIVRTGISR
ncbi:hypothetical protein Ae406Ps2_2885c [Pseudonocardia sp. Ae406_Ps2]|uniref:hypothetical protein n=1 Tax=unclassified Pseudonocardia TaxID=2619320 RepID=UPI0005C28E57|nr:MULTISPECIES: hypothetical protein [unclassified Pseudonocardia]OLL99374.1 hypothetical protein Ae331Ps2_3041 [Pseudonocardia sp. Ae331_Ps2]OLM02885.1 hypothetical protein Ae406Ps2_2885c [Pseudonocardia sp. Ae406_Ps2]OLM12265.1 hypothetical protein Ae505Ps2_2392 [Pseudonocardia sp. Ae505_Ps2]OLM12268.1 hypothetical protein Ae505Ps2_2395 [Pseudonocardia sp. Ae505_Ps2]OLM24463.1 hypothetical protein Ae706Ps2_2896c [Pseudonocardia sp. Ae706_Ps2]